MNPETPPIISPLSGRRVLVAGDSMVDHYIWGRAERISPEAPVPVLAVDREEYRPGGAANVAANIVALGGVESRSLRNAMLDILRFPSAIYMLKQPEKRSVVRICLVTKHVF